MSVNPFVWRLRSLASTDSAPRGRGEHPGRVESYTPDHWPVLLKRDGFHPNRGGSQLLSENTALQQNDVNKTNC
ncbi:hypothetical protein EYF80_007911 [Liparis tanakae]|uniref:Uncharacterized protein n=1 Tax=Liparis tanakae TaxID=230148 RepID=A0A4Z2IWX1_9TELE|nr:hypothetical protein EYF80_007911 [Liparis tanakae]